MTEVNLSTNIIIKNKNAFDELVKYIRILETTTPSKCDRCHNKKKYSRAILPIAKLCVSCREEVKL